jgi:hypothetical protein
MGALVVACPHRFALVVVLVPARTGPDGDGPQIAAEPDGRNLNVVGPLELARPHVEHHPLHAMLASYHCLARYTACGQRGVRSGRGSAHREGVVLVILRLCRDLLVN